MMRHHRMDIGSAIKALENPDYDFEDYYKNKKLKNVHVPATESSCLSLGDQPNKNCKIYQPVRGGDIIDSVIVRGDNIRSVSIGLYDMKNMTETEKIFLLSACTDEREIVRYEKTYPEGVDKVRFEPCEYGVLTISLCMNNIFVAVDAEYVDTVKVRFLHLRTEDRLKLCPKNKLEFDDGVYYENGYCYKENV